MKKYLLLVLLMLGFDGCPSYMEEDVKAAETKINNLKLEISVDLATEQ